jgi:hypothetical protein
VELLVIVGLFGILIAAGALLGMQFKRSKLIAEVKEPDADGKATLNPYARAQFLATIGDVGDGEVSKVGSAESIDGVGALEACHEEKEGKSPTVSGSRAHLDGSLARRGKKGEVTVG